MNILFQIEIVICGGERLSRTQRCDFGDGSGFFFVKTGWLCETSCRSMTRHSLVIHFLSGDDRTIKKGQEM